MAQIPGEQTVNIDAVIQRLETIPGLSGKIILGHPTFMESIEGSPYVWITGIVELPGDNQRLNGPVRQRVEVRIDLTIGTRNNAAMAALRSDIQSVLLNFQSEPKDDPMTKGRGQMEFMDPAWTVWLDSYLTAYQVDALA